jgi:hypothetical protein
MRIDSSGNVGIGTTSPVKQLTLAAADTSTIVATALNHGASNYWGVGSFTDQSFRIAKSHGLEDANTYFAIDRSNGNVGIGTSSPAHKLSFGNHIPSDGKTITVFESGNIASGIGVVSGVYRNFTDETSALSFGHYAHSDGTTYSERMRVDNSGNLLINQTSSNLTFGKLQVSAGGETAGHGGIVGFFDTDGSVASSNLIQVLSFSGDTDATGGQFLRFRDNNSVMGSVSAASGTTVAYNTSSDRRMKENIEDASPQLEVINNIQVREFDWKINGHHEVGLIAQELNDLIPNVVLEGGDDVSELPWGVDYGKLTPYLIKAIQEQQTIIDDLKTRIETLEG